MHQLHREQRILELLAENSGVRVSELSQLFRVSEATIRRDLDRLNEIGRIQRIHGGAVLVETSAPEPPVLHRLSEALEEKRRIGRLAASLVKDGETIFIGSGTTALEIARNLNGLRNLTVITNTLTVANQLAQEEKISLVVAGGLLRRSEFSFIGHIVEQSLREVRVDRVFIGIRAIDIKNGMSNDYLPEVMTDRAIIDMAPELIVVADHTKFGKVSSAYLAPVSRISVLVTDDGADPDMLACFRELGVKVLVA